MTIALPDDVKHLSWAAEQLGIGESTAYRLASTGQIAGVFKIGAQWRVSVPKFMAEIHGQSPTSPPPL
jgi:excisionase family DNA binding protein